MTIKKHNCIPTKISKSPLWKLYCVLETMVMIKLLGIKSIHLQFEVDTSFSQKRRHSVVCLRIAWFVAIRTLCVVSGKYIMRSEASISMIKTTTSSPRRFQPLIIDPVVCLCVHIYCRRRRKDAFSVISAAAARVHHQRHSVIYN